jgi:hypothetical protein
MAKDEKPKDLMGYETLQQEALRGVIKAALARVAPPRGLPGEHHFYISFRTAAPGVSIPSDLAARYPDEMTIVGIFRDPAIWRPAQGPDHSLRGDHPLL